MNKVILKGVVKVPRNVKHGKALVLYRKTVEMFKYEAVNDWITVCKLA